MSGEAIYRKAVFPMKYIQGAGAISELPALAALFGDRAFIVASPSAAREAGKAFEAALPEGRSVEVFKGECKDSELERLTDGMKKSGTDVVVGAGGGKTIDSAKIIADRMELPVVVVPTIASTDAPCSGCAVVYDENGTFQRVEYQKQNPAAVLVDTAIIARAPVRYLVAGMGDALSTVFEARSCIRTHSQNCCGGYSTLAAIELAELCYSTLKKYGAAALMACERGVVTQAVEYIVEANTLLSGVGFESSGLATAHAVHNGLTALSATHGRLHGEKVAFGTLTGLHLNGESKELLEDVYCFCESIGLPTTFEDLGLKDVSCEDLMVAATRTCAQQESIHHEALAVTPEQVRAEVLTRLKTIGAGGGLIIGPTHHVQLDTPMANFWAMANAITGTPYTSVRNGHV